MEQAIPDTMRAAALESFGSPQQLGIKTVPVPDIAPDEILIRVEAAGVGVWDPFELEGGFAKMFGFEPNFPYVPGSDGAGTVVAVGKRVRRFKEGQRAYGFSEFKGKGFYAEYAAVKADHAGHVPDGVPTEQAGAMPVDAITALCGLDGALKLKQGESVMIFGASGGIGHLAVQLAKRMGARVFAVASGDDGAALARSLGADEAINGRSADVAAAAGAFAPEGLDAALLTAGGRAAEEALGALRDGGRVAYPHGVEPEPQGSAGLKVTAYDGIPDPRLIEKLNRLIAAGPFQVHIAQSFPLEQAVAAEQALSGHYLGKLELRPAV